VEEKDLKKKMDRILREIRWIQQNLNPPVNHFVAVIVSVITTIITYERLKDIKRTIVNIDNYLQ